MSHQKISLSYQARRELLARVTPRYHAASVAQKSLLLDAFVELTGYTRKHAIGLLNHAPDDNNTLQRSRPPHYGPLVQQALFLAWKAANHICAKRLIPFLPILVAALERHGHLQISEESRSQLLSMSAKTAERYLRTQRKSRPHGISTTQAGPLLKHQIPIRTFQDWDEAQPGFLEADLVAHCAGNLEGNYLYTLTLTDVATGWTECLPLPFRSPEAVQAALHQARLLFPFPILGVDTDNGGEFINEEIAAYCAQEHITFTRGRPYAKNDHCYIEQKNGAIVRQIVGYERFAGLHASRQLRELYRALRLSVNCFQPSMKLQSKLQQGEKVRRVYDPAKTPLQRLFLSGILPANKRQELQEVAQALDPLGLFGQLEQLQQALFRCTVGSSLAQRPLLGLLRFSGERCMAGTFPVKAVRTGETVPDPTTTLPLKSQELPQVPRLSEVLDGSQTTRDPFEEEWELILSFVLAHPDQSSSEVFQEMQRRFPGRHQPSHLATLQRGIRQIRAYLLRTWEEEDRWPQEVIGESVPDAVSLDQQEHGTTEEHPRPLVNVTIAGGRHPTIQPADEQAQDIQHMLAPGDSQGVFPVMTITLAIHHYVQEQLEENRSPHTVEWHQTALGYFQQYLVSERHLLLPSQITGCEVRDWVVFLGKMPTATGEFRSPNTIATYARSARAFCHWLVQHGYLERTPFATVPFPKEHRKSICVIEPEEWERLQQACQPPEEIGLSSERAAARNRAILWVFLETGIRLSELCDREQGTLRVRGKGSKERWIPLSPNGRHQLFSYLDRHRPTERVLEVRGHAEEEIKVLMHNAHVNQTWNEELQPLADMDTAWNQYYGIDSQIRSKATEQSNSNRMLDAEQISTGPANQAFGTFTDAVSRLSKANRDHYNATLNATQGALPGYILWSAILFPVMGLLAVAGVWHRHKDF